MSSFCQSKSVAKQVLANVNNDDVYVEIEKLQSAGINVAEINKLKAAGLCTVLSIIQATKKELCNIKGLSEAKVEKIVEAAQKLEQVSSFQTGTEVLAKRQNILRITTGSEQFDKMLLGGFESMCITEIFGENRCGKTQICHTLCVTAQLPTEMSGANGKVCFIDTEGTFRPERIAKISERFGLQGDVTLDNILYARAYTHEHLNQLISAAAGKMIEERFALLIVDSIIALFRTEFSGRGELAERQQILNKTLSKLNKLADQFNIAVVMTNHVMADPAGGMTFMPNIAKPVGGHIIGHASHVRLSLRKGKGEQRVCKVYGSPHLPESECVIQLSDGGIIDPSD
ncbi:meiotic recombination protein DMC1-like protein, putative [Cryptosporidium muris RN66]|uniref:Meiotic recombination protein DMC1-like protein, putative n=1 Tax=Cryptosporidium muris (strain RN66) TaxID=441375 RepID=B6AFJ5_CRYMR|nr:meiotic recombination protein DMC1-like protein, putative [Cryptosporidium muris RN66]EEA06986.1 meiotic recombination protein DMC1-like protein, putative [Cryptosporidium muris RN66]|eukprot:XP_002141335.1 meiotic recombination protein DMC1-like protein [Cryptosporidium muris RN66]